MNRQNKHIAFPFLVILLVTSLNTVAQEEDQEHWIKISGSILDDSTDHPVPFAHILDITRYRGTSADHEGKFRIRTVAFDTLKITAIGYKDFYYIPYNVSEDEIIKIQIYLKPTAYTLDEIDIYSEEPIKKFFRDQGQTKSYPINMGKGNKSYNPNASTAGIGYIEAFANLFNQHYKQEKKLSKLKEEEVRMQKEVEQNQRIKSRFGIKNLTRLTGLREKEVANFMREYPMPDMFILNANEYEYLAVVMRNLRDYKFRHKLEMDIEEILKRAVFADEK